MNVKSALHNPRMLLLVLVLVIVGIFFAARTFITGGENIGNVISPGSNRGTIPGFTTDFDKKSIELSQLLSGGPGKDGIPAIDNPKFTSITDADFEDDALGILIDMEGEQRYYPYNILVWHEIVNDSIGNNHFAVTFCPLCGSAIVFNREIDGNVVRFGVSGLLFESNLVMYDDITESFWSQSKGEGVVGEHTGRELEILPMQLVSFGEVKAKYRNAKVLSKDTGHFRNYSINPYGDYDNNEDVFFPISVRDTRFPAKEVMFIIRFGDKSIAMQQINLRNGETSTFDIDGERLTAARVGEELEVTRENGELLPGYFEMWFSWAIHNQETGEVWEIN